MPNPPLAIDPVPILSTSFLTLVDKRLAGHAVPITESYQVSASATIRLRECPEHDSPSTINIPGYSEVSSTPSPGQFTVDYGNGILTFNAAQIGTVLTISYLGTGSVIQAADSNNITIPLVPFYNKLDGIVPDGGGPFTFSNNIVVSSPYTITGIGTGLSQLMQRYDAVATSGQMVFTPGFVSTAGTTLVYSEGLLMTLGSSNDYTITGGGNSITFNVGRPTNEAVSIIKIGI